MNVTFLIGNGFDVNLGLKTKYKDFYDRYIESNAQLSNDNCIKKFCDLIEPDHETWGDFEMAFANHISGDKRDVGEILYDFSDKFLKYLSSECEKCSYVNPENATSFKEFLLNGYTLLEKRDRQIIEQMYRAANREDIQIRFINFNYTNTVNQLCDQLIKSNSNSKKLRKHMYSNTEYSEYIGDELHIHGTLQDYIVIGIDSLSQIQDEQLKNNKSVEKYCVKDEINSDNGNPQIINKYTELINSSNIIYAYGISFGESDKSRWEIIHKWLKSSSAHKLIIYKWGINLKNFSRAYNRKLLDAIDDYKNEYLKLLGFNEDEYEIYYNQIFVLDSSDVLNFKLKENNNDESKTDELTMAASGI